MTETNEVSPIDALVAPVDNFNIVLSPGTDTELFLQQKPLTFFGKMEFFSVMGNAIDRALSGGLSVADLLDVPDRDSGRPLDASSLKEADLFVKAVVKLVQGAPETLLDIYCIVLGVPSGERFYVKQRLETELTDEQGVAILNNFVDQNWDVMVNFFKDQVSPLVGKISGKLQVSESSKPSTATRQRTPKK